MDRQAYERIKASASGFVYSSFEYTVYEIVEHYLILREDEQAIFAYGENKEAGLYELRFAVNAIETLIDMISTLPKDTLITMVPVAYKERLVELGCEVYGELQDYWIDDLENVIKVERALEPGHEIGFINTHEYQVASFITQSVRFQSREFHGESPEWIEAWASGEEANAKAGGASDCNVFVYRIDAEPVGVLCVALYGHDSPKGTIVWIREIAVRPEHQGRGIGRALMNCALDYGKSKSAKRAFLMADNCNMNAIGLYKSIGFMPKVDDMQLDMLIKKGTQEYQQHDKENTNG